MVYGRQLKQTKAELLDHQTNTSSFSTRHTARIIGALAAMLLLCSSSFGDILVQPIILKQLVTPGRRGMRLNLRLENMSPTVPEDVSVQLAGLTQREDGAWKEILSGDTSVDTSSLRSCKDWLTIQGETTVRIDPLRSVPCVVTVDVPPGIRGFYFASLIATTQPRETLIEGMTTLTRLEYVVPIILEAQSIPVPHDVKLTKVSLEYVAPTVETPTASVLGVLEIANNGGTYSRLKCLIRVWQQAQGHWVKVADLTLPDNGIIPGVTLKLKQELGVVLPSGKYKIEGYVYVDGQRGNGIFEEVDFEGDRRVAGVQSLVPLDLDKEEILIDMVPGAIRQGSVLVGNGSEEPVTVDAELILPSHMLNVVNGQGMKGDDMGCAGWITLQPQQFKLIGYGRRNLSLIARMPKTGMDYSDYYGTLRLHATNADGSPAGVKEITVCVKNGKVTGQDMVGSTAINIASTTPARYLVTASFANVGMTYVTPRCRGVLTGEGDAIYEQFLMNSEAHGQTGILLPFESRTFSGVLDIAAIPEGYYRLTTILEFTDRTTPRGSTEEKPQNQMLLEVYMDQATGQKCARSASWDKATDGNKGRTIIRL